LHLSAEELELEAKFAATEKTLDACNSFLERAWAAPGSTLRLKDSEWRLEKPEIKRRRHRYFDTPTLLIRQHGGGIRVRDREGDMVFTVKLPVLTSDLRRFEWEQTMPGIHSLEEVTEKHIRQMLLECTTCSSESATTEPCLGALKYLLDANVPLRGVLQLDIRLVVWKLVNPRNRGHVLVSLDRVKVMAEESEVTSFCEIEVESRDECPETDWHSLCRHVETEFGLQDLGKCSKYERALSLIANR
jgi:inorganic triphosphatase YgiF